jgi:hypothetical protein
MSAVPVVRLHSASDFTRRSMMPAAITRISVKSVKEIREGLTILPEAEKILPQIQGLNNIPAAIRRKPAVLALRFMSVKYTELSMIFHTFRLT